MSAPRPRRSCGFLLSGAAVIAGWPAGEIARLVRRHCREALEDYDPTIRCLLEEGLQALEDAAADWRARGRDTGNAETPTAEVDVPCSQDGEISPAEAALALGVDVRQLRNLRAAGELPEPRREGRRCWYEADAVYELRDRRKADHG